MKQVPLPRIPSYRDQTQSNPALVSVHTAKTQRQYTFSRLSSQRKEIQINKILNGQMKIRKPDVTCE